MLRKVKITAVPKARTGYQVQGALVNDVPAMGGKDYNAYIGMKKPQVRSNITAVPRDEANLEAEGGETVIGNIDGSGMPSFFNIKGPRHHSGGVPLSLPDDSFIFSDTQSMKITDPTILKMFGKAEKKGGYTPAELSKLYDLNKYRKILQDPDADKIAKKTAELMIKNYTVKLGALALAQEAKKGFPQGIPAIAEPYMETNGIKEKQVMPELAVMKQQRDQMMNQQSQADGEEPYIEPEAQEDMSTMEPGMSPDQMPMGMYGIEIGDYGYPMFNDPSMMRVGGQLPKAATGAVTPYEKAKTASGNVTPTGKSNKYSSRKQDINEYLSEWEKYIPGISDMTDGEAQSAIYDWSLENNPEAIKDMWKEFGLTTKGKKNKELLNLSKNKSGVLDEETLNDPQVLKQLKDAYVDNYFGARQVLPKAIAQEPVETSEPEAEKTTPKDVEETPKKTEIPNIPQKPMMNAPAPPKQDPQWWLQDSVNTMGAFGNLMSLNKYMPWEARTDLEEPRPTFLDPTRELAAQSEQANIAAQAAGQFAGPQALNARLSQIQGQAARSAGDALSRINNANVNIANQFEANQAAIRNQESALNQQMANRVYDKNTIANQQFDNAKRQGRADLRNAYTNAVTNRWKTDALNQLYPNYQTLPGVGGKVIYTPTDKNVTPEKPDQNYGEQLLELIQSGWDKDAAQKLLIEQYKADLKNHKSGGSTTGYVYTNWPIFL